MLLNYMKFASDCSFVSFPLIGRSVLILASQQGSSVFAVVFLTWGHLCYGRAGQPAVCPRH